MNDKEKNSTEHFSFITVIMRFFKRRKFNFTKVKKKRKKEFVAVIKPLNNNSKRSDIKTKKIDEKDEKKNISEAIVKKNQTSSISKKKKIKDEKQNIKKNSELVKENKVDENNNYDINDSTYSDNYVEFNDMKDNISQNDILIYFDSYLKEKRYLVNSYLSLYDMYNKDAQNTLLYKEACDISLKIDDLLENIHKLKNELHGVEKYIKFDNNCDIDNKNISYLLEEYKKEFNNKFDFNFFENVGRANEYTSIIVKLNEIEQVTDKLSVEMQLMKALYKQRDKDFSNLKKKFFDYDKSYEMIKSMIKDNDDILRDLEYKISNSKKIVTDIQKVYRRVDDNLKVLLLSYLAIRKNPSVSKTVKFAVATGLVLESVKNMINYPRVSYCVRKQIIIEDYEKEIIDSLNSLDDISKFIDITIKNVGDMKKEIETKFKEYDIPEYIDILNKLDELDKNLDERRDYLKYSKHEFNEQLEKNKVKVKELNYNSYDKK